MIHVYGQTITLGAAVNLRGYLDRQIEAARALLENPVQVRYLDTNWGETYAYSDPSAKVVVGDTVEVEAGGQVKLGTVVSFGRGGYEDELKPIRAIIRKEVL